MLSEPHHFWFINKQVNGVELTHDVLLLPLPQSSRDHPTQHFSCVEYMHIWKKSWNNLIRNAFQNTGFYDNDTGELCNGKSSRWYEWVGSCIQQYTLLRRGKSEMLAYEIQKITKTIWAVYWNRLGLIEAGEDDRAWEDHSNGRQSEKYSFIAKRIFTVLKPMITIKNWTVKTKT